MALLCRNQVAGGPAGGVAGRLLRKGLGAAVASFSTFRAEELENFVRPGAASIAGMKPLDQLSFGQDFAPHMLHVRHSAKDGWSAPVIKQLEPMLVHPAAPGIQYGVSCFEGMKAYADPQGKLLLFRPELNAKRLLKSMARISLPTFEPEEFIGCVEELVRTDADWVPKEKGYSLYLRPFAFGSTPALGVAPPNQSELMVIMSPVGPYYPAGLVPIRVLLDEENVRAFKGGVGSDKVGGNYAPTLVHMVEAAENHGCKQVLYTIPGPNGDGDRRFIAECGAMNVFFLLEHEAGAKRELVTPPLDGTILPGVTRDSIISLVREKYGDEVTLSERQIAFDEVERHASEGTLREMFGSGTACVIQPISALVTRRGETVEARTDIPKEDSLMEKIHKDITDIQFGLVKHPWQRYF